MCRHGPGAVVQRACQYVRSTAISPVVQVASTIASTSPVRPPVRAAALAGEIADPRALHTGTIGLPDTYLVDDSGIFPPAADPAPSKFGVVPTSNRCRTRADLEETLGGEVLLKLGDNISTDHILPAGPQVLPLRSNVPAIAEYLFRYVDPTFVERVKARAAGFSWPRRTTGRGVRGNMRRCVRCSSA